MGREGDMIGRKARQKGVRVETMRQGDRDRVGEGGGGGSRFGASGWGRGCGGGSGWGCGWGGAGSQSIIRGL